MFREIPEEYEGNATAISFSLKYQIKQHGELVEITNLIINKSIYSDETYFSLGNIDGIKIKVVKHENNNIVFEICDGFYKHCFSIPKANMNEIENQFILEQGKALKFDMPEDETPFLCEYVIVAENIKYGEMVEL